MMGARIEIDISEESKDPCKHLMISFISCAKGIPREESIIKCDHFGHEYMECKTNPRYLKNLAKQNKNKDTK